MNSRKCMQMHGNLLNCMDFDQIQTNPWKSQCPVPGTQYPEPGIQYPVPSTQYPVPSTQYPMPGTRYPVPGTQYPVHSTQHPAPSTQHPIPNTQYPVPGTQHPIPSTQYPSMISRPKWAEKVMCAEIGRVHVAQKPAVHFGRALTLCPGAFSLSSVVRAAEGMDHTLRSPEMASIAQLVRASG